MQKSPLAEWQMGSIPARAGYTALQGLSWFIARVNPRSRGVHGNPWLCLKLMRGQSPLARGTHVTPLCRIMVLGSIPARSRGVHMASPKFPPGARGQSPLARGTRCLLAWLRVNPRSRGVHPGLFPGTHGSIPARAGYTLCHNNILRPCSLELLDAWHLSDSE